MATIYDADTNKLIEKVALELKQLIKAPEWSIFVKTGMSKERPPVDRDWWYHRAASILRTVYIKGPIGTSKLRVKYGSRKNRGVKPEKFYPGSGKIIRVILQQLEKAELIQQSEKSKRKGRIITKKGKSFLDKLSKNVQSAK
ncbi:MAG: 30S ribosomal protein S19e [archaeon]